MLTKQNADVPPDLFRRAEISCFVLFVLFYVVIVGVKCH